MAEISRLERRQEDRAGAGLEDIRLERGRLALIEQRIKEILAVLKSLNSMVRLIVIIDIISFEPHCLSERLCLFMIYQMYTTFVDYLSLSALSQLLTNHHTVLTKYPTFQRISPRILGSMVISAVEAAYDTERGEVDVAVFLNLLFSETREYERQKAESILSEAMEAVTAEAESDDSSGGR